MFFVFASFLGLVFIFSLVLISVYIQPRFVMKFIKYNYPDIFWYKNTNDNIVSITIDDSPTEDTNNILDILDNYNCKVTFFFIIESYVKSKKKTFSLIFTFYMPK